MKRLAIVVGLGVALATLVYVGASLLLAAMDLDYSELLAARLTKITGREVRLGSVSRLEGALRPRIEVRDLVILGSSEVDESVARIDRMVIGLDLVPLLRGVVHVDHIELRGLHLAISTDAEGELTWAPSFDATFTPAPSDGVEVEIDDLDLFDADVVYQDGVTGETSRSRLDRLRVDLDDEGREVEIVASGAVDGVDFELEGRFERITSDGREGYVGTLEGRLEQGRIEASGTVVSPLRLQGVDLEFTARLTEPLLVGGLELPPAVAKGWLRDRDGQLGLEDLEIEIARASDRLSVSGDVRDLIGDPQLQLEAQLELQDASSLTQLVNLELPDLGPIQGSASLTSADGVFDLADLEVEVGGEGSPRLRARGTVSDLTGLREVDLEVSASSGDVRDFAPALLAERFSLGPVRGSARLVGAGDAFHLESIDLEAGAHEALWARVTGRIDILPGDMNLDLVARFESTRASELERILEVDLPNLEPLRGSIGIRGGSLGVDAEQIEIHIGEGGDVLVDVTGEVRDLTDEARARLRLELRAPLLSAVGALFDQDLPDVGPVRASARLSTAENRWALRDLKAELGETRLSGSAARLIAADGRPRLSVELDAPRIHLASTRPPFPEELPPVPEEGWWRREIPLDPLRALDGDLVLRVDALTTEEERLLENLTLHIVLDQGVLRVNPLSFSFEGGMLSGEARLDARGSEPSWSLRLRGSGMDLARFSSRFTDREIVSGLALASFDLSTRGTNALALLHALDGDLKFVLRQGHVSSDYALLFQRDVMRALAFKGAQAETLPISCLIVDLELEQGIAESEEVFIDSEQTFVHVTGKIDFRKERYDLLLTPKVKKASLFSVIVPVTVTGPLDEPVIRASKRSLARDASIAVVGNLLVPGAGLLAPFLRSGTAGRDPCANAVTAYLSSQTEATAESR